MNQLASAARRFLIGIAVLAVLAVASRAVAQTPATSPTADARVTNELLTLAREQNAAIKNHDRIALERIYAPEFFIVHAYGYVDSRAEHIDQLLARDSTDLLPLPTFTPPEELNVYGDVAVYRYAGATTIGTPAVGMRVYVRRNGRWQITQTQSTEMIPAPQAVAVAVGVLDAYVGRYSRGDGRYVGIARDGDALVRILPGLPKVRLTPVSETRFIDKIGAEWTFRRGATGRVTELTQRFRDREWRASRVE